MIEMMITSVLVLVAFQVNVIAAARARGDALLFRHGAIKNVGVPKNANGLKALEQQIRQVVEKVRPCVVGFMSIGGGVIVSEDGYVLTSAGRVRGARAIVPIRIADGRFLDAKVVEIDDDVDIALVKILSEEKWPFVELGRCDTLRRGQWCVDMGYPPALGSFKLPSVRVGRFLENDSLWLVTDCFSCGCGRGSPLFDLDGKLVGVALLDDKERRDRSHVAVDAINSSWRQLVKGEQPSTTASQRTSLGISPRKGIEKGQIGRVFANSPAEKAGLKPGDVIVRFEGKPVERFIDLLVPLRQTKPGQTVSIEVLRGEEMLTCAATLGAGSPLPRTSLPVVHPPGGPLFVHWQSSWQSKHSGSTRYRKRFMSLEHEFREAVEAAKASTVGILRNGEAVGLGVVVAPDGHVAAKASLFNGEITCRLSDGCEVRAELVGANDAHDLGLLKVEATRLKPVLWRTEGVLPVGSLMIAIGQQHLPLAIGIVSTAPYRVPGRRQYRSRRPVFGAFVGTSHDGKRIGPIEQGRAAEKAGLKLGDLVTSVDGESVRLESRWREIRHGHAPGQTITLDVLRNGVQKQISLTFSQELGKIQREHHGALVSLRSYGFPMVIQHDAHVQRPNLGGPLLDTDGKVAAINIARPHSTVTYAIPANIIQKVLYELRKQ